MDDDEDEEDDDDDEREARLVKAHDADGKRGDHTLYTHVPHSQLCGTTLMCDLFFTVLL